MLNGLIRKVDKTGSIDQVSGSSRSHCLRSFDKAIGQWLNRISLVIWAEGGH